MLGRIRAPLRSQANSLRIGVKIFIARALRARADQGRVVAEGTPDEIRKESNLKRIYMGAGAAAPKNGATRG